MKRILLLLVMLSIHGAAAAEELQATLDWSQRVGLGLTVSGVVARVPVSPGQRVEKGQLLVALDDAHLQARIARAEAELEEARQNRDEGARELERALELYDRTVLSDHELRLAEIGEARGKAAWHKARAELAEARVLLRQSRVLAPFAGRVIAVAAQPGQAVINGLRAETLVELARDDRLVARAAIGAELAARLEAGGGASVEVSGQRLEARVEQVGLEPVETAADGAPRYELRVVFERPEGMPARAGLPLVIHTLE